MAIDLYACQSSRVSIHSGKLITVSAIFGVLFSGYAITYQLDTGGGGGSASLLFTSPLHKKSGTPDKNVMLVSVVVQHFISFCFVSFRLVLFRFVLFRFVLHFLLP